MFTGIVQQCLQPTKLQDKDGIREITFQFSTQYLVGLQQGASVAIDGVCLTVSFVANNCVTFQIIPETLNKTTLGSISKRDFINIERALKVGDELGGHILGGHIIGKIMLHSIINRAADYRMAIKIPLRWRKYFYEKGFIALQGISLTIAEYDITTGMLTVALIPETLGKTNLQYKKEGELLNLEIDSNTFMMVQTAERLLQNDRGKKD